MDTTDDQAQTTPEADVSDEQIQTTPQADIASDQIQIKPQVDTTGGETQTTPEVDPHILRSHLPQSHTLPLEERYAAGKALRKECGRKSHAALVLPAHRADPIDLLERDNQGRVEDLVPIRYGRMAANPFAFFRGSASVMAFDLANTPSTGLKMQICGDCHLLNFGGFATTERKIIFDINDFDETSIAPWEWDVKRLAASFVIAGRYNGFSQEDCRAAARQAALSYRLSVANYASMPVLQAWYDALDMEQIIANITNKQMKDFYSKKLQSAKSQSEHEKEYAKLAYAAGDSPRIIDHPPLIFHYDDTRTDQFRAQVERVISDYLSSLAPERRVLLSRFKLADTALKVVGVGSVGTFCGIALFISGNGDPLFLQFKQAGQSVLEPYAGPSSYSHPGQRVVVGQRLMQAAGDMFLGWFTGSGDMKNKFYMRQLRDVKIKPVVELMKAASLINYAGLCGQALARAHARSGDAAILAGYMGKSSRFEDSLADFGAVYADQNERDHAALLEAVQSGRIEAQFEE